MHRDERDEELARLRAATEAIAPDDGFTDEMVSAAAGDRAADALADIARATRSLDAASGLADAVMMRVERAKASAPRAAPSWLDGVVRTGPIAVGLAAIAAAASLVLFLSSEGDVDATLASSVDAVEVIE